MRKQVWYFKFDTCILGPIVTRAKWAGREYHPEDLPDYVYTALGMAGHKRLTRARMYPDMPKEDAYTALGCDFPLHWRWNRIEIAPMIETLNNLAHKCYQLLELIPKTEENHVLRFRLYLFDEVARNHAHDLQCLSEHSVQSIKDDLYWTKVKLDKLVALRAFSNHSG